MINLMPEAIAMVRSLTKSLMVSEANVGVTVSSFINPSLRSLLLTSGNVIIVDPRDYLSEIERISQSFDYVIVIAPPKELVETTNAIDGNKLLQPPRDLIRIFSSKYDTIKELSRCGFKVPKTELIISKYGGNKNTTQIHSSTIIKPTYSAGSECVYLVNNDYELRQALAHVINCDPYGMAVHQEFINGVHGSISVVYGINGPLFYSLNLQLINNTNGSLHFIGGILPIRKVDLQRKVEELIHDLFNCYPELRGYIGLDVVWNDDGIYIIEINPRPTTSIAGIVSLYPDFGKYLLNVYNMNPAGPVFLGDVVNDYAYYVFYDSDYEKNLGINEGIYTEVLSVFQRKLEIGRTKNLFKIYQRIKPLLNNLVYNISNVLH